MAWKRVGNRASDGCKNAIIHRDAMVLFIPQGD